MGKISDWAEDVYRELVEVEYEQDRSLVSIALALELAMEFGRDEVINAAYQRENVELRARLKVAESSGAVQYLTYVASQANDPDERERATKTRDILDVALYGASPSGGGACHFAAFGAYACTKDEGHAGEHVCPSGGGA